MASEAPLLIIGQGLAGSLLGWACERAGRAFRVFDAGHDAAASRVGAGLINPLSGPRLAPVWRVADWREPAVAVYRELEHGLGVSLVTEIRIRRRYRAAAERARLQPRLALAEVARWVEAHDEDGLWIRGGVQVETARLIAALRERWRARGWLVEQRIAPGRPAASVLAEHGAGAMVWCTGAAESPLEFAEVPWQRAKGELLVGRLAGLEPGVLLNDGQWVLPGSHETARVGATFNRDDLGLQPTEEARTQLIAAAQRLSGNALELLGHEVGCRVTAPDRRPVVGWAKHDSRVGLFSGLGSKGALWAPVLARQWVAAAAGSGSIDPEADIRRFDQG